MSAVLSFLYCTLTGVGALLLVFAVSALLFSPIYGLMWLWERMAETRPQMKRFSSRVGANFGWICLILFVGGVLSVFILGMHDWGCDIHGHPEHKILLKDDKTSDHGHKL